ncbi:MAG: DUF2127 domain-containing protein [Deltaproteobacteria bacterium]
MKKHETFLKIIIIEKFTLGIIATLLSFGVINLINKDMEVFTNQIVDYFDLDMDNRYIEAVITKIGMIKNGTIIGVSIGMVSYALLNLAMGYGLHRRKRWAEWLTVIATALLIPFEIYEIIQEQTTIYIGVLILNCAIVYYLAKHKELFKR